MGNEQSDRPAEYTKAAIDSEFEAWKLSVGRAAAYIQSNALFQIQLFGFFSAAVVISIGQSSTDDTRSLILRYVIPMSSFVALYVSGYYFNRLTTQHVFIRLYGDRYRADTLVKSPDVLWEITQLQDNVSVWSCARYLVGSRGEYTGPYFTFFLLYIAVGITSFSYSFRQRSDSLFNMASQAPFLFIIAIILWLASFFGLVLLVAFMTRRAWRAIDYERRVRLGELMLLAKREDRIPRKR